MVSPGHPRWPRLCPAAGTRCQGRNSPLPWALVVVQWFVAYQALTHRLPHLLTSVLPVIVLAGLDRAVPCSITVWPP